MKNIFFLLYVVQRFPMIQKNEYDDLVAMSTTGTLRYGLGGANHKYMCTEFRPTVRRMVLEISVY
jgi:hypothetical protein